ncbi:MAG: hypothetical protein ACOX20_11625, partial [Limnochordia bacterium]
MGLLDNWHKWWRQGPEQGDDDGLFNLNPAQARRAKLTVVLLLVGPGAPGEYRSGAKTRGPERGRTGLCAQLRKKIWSDFQTRLERSLAGTLTQIAGVGEVRVLLTVDGPRRE